MVEQRKQYRENDAPAPGELWGRDRGIRNQEIVQPDKTVDVNAIFCEVCHATPCAYKAPNRHK